MSSSGRKVARIISVLIAMLLLFSIPVLAGFAVANATSGMNQHVELAPDVLKDLQAQLKEYLRKDMQLRNWKVIDQKVTLTTQK